MGNVKKLKHMYTQFETEDMCVYAFAAENVSANECLNV